MSNFVQIEEESLRRLLRFKGRVKSLARLIELLKEAERFYQNKIIDKNEEILMLKGEIEKLKRTNDNLQNQLGNEGRIEARALLKKDETYLMVKKHNTSLIGLTKSLRKEISRLVSLLAKNNIEVKSEVPEEREALSS